MKPSDTAEIDQELAAALIQLDSWIRELRRQMTERGQLQGLANTALTFSTNLSAGYTQGILAAALYRLATQDPEPDNDHDTIGD